MIQNILRINRSVGIFRKTKVIFYPTQKSVILFSSFAKGQHNFKINVKINLKQNSLLKEPLRNQYYKVIVAR